MLLVLHIDKNLGQRKHYGIIYACVICIDTDTVLLYSADVSNMCLVTIRRL